MKSIQTKIIACACAGICLILFSSCSKNVSSSTAKPASAGILAGLPDSKTTLILQPGPADGQDGYVNYDVNDPNSVNSNFDDISELCAASWTSGGEPVTVRFFVKFDSLIKIPSTAKIISATFQLYGLVRSSLVAPQGNSVYPKSPYGSYPDNNLLVQRISAPWDAATVTWATQPGAYKENEETIPSSTRHWDYNPKIDVTEFVKKMVAHPETNYGFKMTLADENPYRSIVFGSSKSTDATRRPRLIIVYK